MKPYEGGPAFGWRRTDLEITDDGRRLFVVRDATFPDAGRVGAWSKADSLTEFDQFREEEVR